VSADLAVVVVVVEFLVVVVQGGPFVVELLLHGVVDVVELLLLLVGVGVVLVGATAVAGRR